MSFDETLKKNFRKMKQPKKPNAFFKELDKHQRKCETPFTFAPISENLFIIIIILKR